MRRFAEEEIVIAEGPYRGRFRVDRQPAGGFYLDLLDSGRWNRHVLTAPTQTGKTIYGFVLPILYHLFEIRETVIVGVPLMEMAKDKWREDIRPVIEASRYRDQIPRMGAGSRGGNFTAIKFRHGPTLRFMGGGGGDKTVAGFTSRVLVVTETDGLDLSGSKSREADRLKQLEARTLAYGSRKRIYFECTVSTKAGRTWQEYTKGTESQIAVRCRHCERWVVPEREDLFGWQDADSALRPEIGPHSPAPNAAACGLTRTGPI